MTIAPRPYDRPAASRGRGACVAWLLAIVLLFQLLVQTQHDHEHASKSHHCVACAVHATPLAGPPVASLAVAPAAALVYILALPVRLVPRPARAADYLLPPPHAPPVFLP
jgi:hypothetical protein